jgi:putative ABC transport system permease protein
MDGLRQDIRYALRSMRRSLGFTFTVLLTLGIGIGANTAIFSFVDTMLLRPLPYPQAERMVMLWQDFSASGGPEQEWFTPPDFRDVRDRAGTLAAVTALVNWAPSLTGGGEPERLTGAFVGAGWFEVTGVRPGIGRGFDEADERGDGRVVVLSRGLWERRFGADPSIVGRSIQLNGEAHEVVGVMPAGFRAPFLQGAELWRPFTESTFSPGCSQSRGCYVMRVMGRLSGGVAPEQVQAELATIAAAIREEDPEGKTGLQLTAVGMQEQLVSPVRPALLALLGAVGLLLLIACVNIANLLLARSAAREREVAVRTAVGARRPAILRQLLVESSVLGLAGGAAGVLLSLWGVQVLRAMSPAGTPRIDEVAVDARILAFAFGLSLLTGLLFGLAPALQLARTDLTRALREAAGPRSGGARRRMRSILVVAQLAIALTLLAGAGLLIRSFLHLQAVDPGFNPDNVLVVNLAFPASRYPDATRTAAAIAELTDRLATRQGVVAAGASTIVPLVAGGDSDISFIIDGQPPPRDRTSAPVAWYRQVTPGYFDAMEMRLLRGRGIEPTDHADALRVAVVNETLARRWWPEGNVLGSRIATSLDGPRITIVGVVADVRHTGPAQDTRGELFLPLAQQPARSAAIVVRATGDPLDIVPAVRAIVREVDADLPLSGIGTMQQAMRQAVAMPRLYLSFFTFFAAVALVLAAIGIYGVTSYAVTQRTAEIGVRMALGANAADVQRLVLRRALLLVSIGLATGTALALALSRLLAGLLFNLSPTDPATFIVIATLLAVVAVVASWLPARRATRVDPLRALRANL